MNSGTGTGDSGERELHPVPKTLLCQTWEIHPSRLVLAADRYKFPTASAARLGAQ